MKQYLPLPAYLPDQSVNSGVLLRAENVYPAADGYKPLGAFLEASDALGGTFAGGYSAIASDSTAYLLAGTDSTLESLQDNTWTDLLTGLTITGRWRFTQFGDFVVAVNGGTTYEVDLIAGTASALVGAPSGNSICVVGDFVVIGQAGADILKVQWSAFNDHTAWTAGLDQSGFQIMNTGGEVQGLVGGEYGVILQRERLVRMTRTGDASAPFQFDEITNNYGCAAAATVAAAGRTIFFLSDRGFMALEDGQQIRPIGNEKVDKTFRAFVAREDYERIFTAIDPENTLVFWSVPGEPGLVWVYNWVLDRWTTFKVNNQGIMSGYTSSIGLEDLSVIYPNIDTMPYSLDDPRFRGGSPRLYAVQSGKVGAYAGDTLEATLDMGFAQLNQGRRARVNRIRLIGDMVDGTTVRVDTRSRLGDSQKFRSDATMNRNGTFTLRANGRFLSTRIVIEAGTDWTYIQGVEYEYQDGGDR